MIVIVERESESESESESDLWLFAFLFFQGFLFLFFQLVSRPFSRRSPLFPLKTKRMAEVKKVKSARDFTSQYSPRSL